MGSKNIEKLIAYYAVAIIILNYKDIKKLIIIGVPILAVGFVEIIYRVYDVRLSMVLCMAISLFIVSTLIITIKNKKELKLKYYILPAIVVLCMGLVYNIYNSHYVRNKDLREILERKIIANGGEEGRANAISDIGVGSRVYAYIGNIKNKNLKDIDKLKNLDSITITGKIFNGNGLKKLENLQKIRLIDPSKETLKFINGIESVKILYLSGSSYTNEYGDFRFRNLSNIEEVIISDISIKNLRVIEELSTVKEIFIFDDIESLDGIENLKNLEVLKCSYVDNIDAIFKNKSIKTVIYIDDRMLEYKDVLYEHGIELVKW